MRKRLESNVIIPILIATIMKANGVCFYEYIVKKDVGTRNISTWIKRPSWWKDIEIILVYIYVPR